MNMGQVRFIFYFKIGVIHVNANNLGKTNTLHGISIDMGCLSLKATVEINGNSFKSVHV